MGVGSLLFVHSVRSPQVACKLNGPWKSTGKTYLEYQYGRLYGVLRIPLVVVSHGLVLPELV